MAIQVDTFDLSLRSTETGEFLTANVYYVEGVTDAAGLPRALSIGELVMALCLDRAAKLEASIIRLMDEMNEVTVKLEAMTEIEQNIVDWASEQATKTYVYLDERSGRTLKNGPYAEVSYLTFLRTCLDENVDDGDDGNLYLDGNEAVWVNVPQGDPTAIKFDDFITAMESKMDQMNSFSQQKMIELQSQTSKRDQAYDMISNVLKSINTVLVGNANNM